MTDEATAPQVSEGAASGPADLPLVEIRGLRKNYWLEDQEIQVLKGIDLDIHPGEQISITGASGSGKSTFLHVLGTLDIPDAGTVKFRGENIFAKSPAQLAAFRNRSIGFVFQFHHLLPEFSALENVAMPAMIQRMSSHEAEERAVAMLDRVFFGAPRLSPPRRTVGRGAAAGGPSASPSDVTSSFARR